MGSCDGAVTISLASVCHLSVCFDAAKLSTRYEEWIAAWCRCHQLKEFYVFMAQPRRLRLALKRRGWFMHAYLTWRFSFRWVTATCIPIRSWCKPREHEMNGT